MATTFRLRVIDVSVTAGAATLGGGEAGATVALVTRSVADAATSSLGTGFYEGFAATHVHVSDGLYDPATPPTPGEWLLVVRAATRCPVVQRLTVADDGGILQVKAGWGSRQAPRDLQAAAVDIVNFKAAKANAKPALQSMVAVKLFPRREFVFMSGTEFHGAGTTWRLFAEGHRNLLRQAGAITDGDLVTLLVCEQRTRRTFVKATGGATAWLVIDEFLKSGTPRNNPNPEVEKVDPKSDLGVLDLYHYLDSVGGASPGTVQEASVFSHAFFDGPILWDTFQDDGSSGGTNFKSDPLKRDPADLDGRAKDWTAGGVMQSFPNLSKSFAGAGFLKTWGCNAETRIGQMIRQAQSKLAPKFARDAPFDFRTTETGSADPDVTSVTIQESMTLAHMLKAEIDPRLRFYNGGAATFLGRRVFGAPPGAGSNFGTKAGSSVMFVNEQENGPIFSFYNRELSAQPAKDADGYYDFQALLQGTSSFPTPTWFTERHRLITKRSAKPTKAITHVRVAAGGFVVRPTADTSFRVEAHKDLVDVGQSGHLFVARLGDFARIIDADGAGNPAVFLDASKTRDAGVYMQNDGTVFLLTRSRGATVWVKHSGPILHFSGTPVTNGVLQKVTPGFIW